MKIDALVAEIGSTTTILNAFTNLNSNPIFLGQGISPTTEEDISIGFVNAQKDLEQKLGFPIEAKDSFASSSAAGGLKMSVHGLVYEMTVKAAKEAALGAGANLHLITAGKLSAADLEKIKKLNLNIIMIAGGVDYGEAETALQNSEAIASSKLNIPVIYAGNIVNQDKVRQVFEKYNQKDYLFITANVYPKIDRLEVGEAREVIQAVFEKHITTAPGMEKIRPLIKGNILPTPGAVMKAALLLQKTLGDLVVADIGGATSDVFSVASDTEEINRILFAPEPFAKRTVEGDLGVFINRENLIKLIGEVEIKKILDLSDTEYQEILKNYQKIPDKKQLPLTELLAESALKIALKRHAGKIIPLYGGGGKKAAEGKDLTGIKYLIGTGGALTRLPNRRSIIEKAIEKNDPLLLLPGGETKVLLDNHYIMAAAGVLSVKYPEAAVKLIMNSLEAI